MASVPQIVPVTDLRLRHLEVFKMLGKGPVILAQRSRPAAVLVSVEDWDARENELDRLRRIVIADAHSAAVDAGDFVDLDDVDLDDLDDDLDKVLAAA